MIDSPAGLSAADVTVCRALLDDLPAQVADQDRSESRPIDALGAAWGDPAVVLRCGVPIPAAFNEVSQCQEADGVGWFVPDEQFFDQEADVVMTTVGYEPRIEVVVPDDYRPAGVADAMSSLAATVKAHLELKKPCH